MDQPDTPSPDQTEQSAALTPETAPKPCRKNRPGAGRPRTEINWQAFEAMCFAHSTLQEIADFFQCSPDTLERAVKREYRQNFAEVFRQKSAKGKISLRRTMWDSALRRHDSRMMIWLSKQHLGMREGIDVNATVTSNPIPPEIEAKDRDTLEREIQEFFAGLDFSKKLREQDAFVARLEDKNSRR